ncbi:MULTISPECIES: S9 family peptidase [Halolamina]|uniref:Acyl-peptide hydrolase n=1 Tax=Halolamina pelagica TaxID=699431 RepID=A0A1I5T0I7_9EURY|nr:MULTISPECIES: S9 family peptidase [Halolamina]NHX36925.1 S9 family peptidase [Halolamina sp. R1-12]SFP75966.1 Dipeptidyl aminopeptidase/acylaminoacyl peptidase [Halolamina pelagica]
MSYGVARYIGIDSTDTPTFTPDGDLAFLADTTGTPQVYRLGSPGAWPERLTAHDERVSFVDTSPTRDELMFGMDEGSNERDQLYRYDLETGEEHQLTDQPESKHLWGGWGPDGDRFAFAANRRQGDTFDVYVQGRDGEGADLVWEGPGGFVGVAAWHPDGDALVLQESNSSADQVLYWLDIESGTTERITDADEEARYHHVNFGPDGDLYAVTDYGAETAYVGRLDVSGRGDGVETIEAGHEEWNVDALGIDAETGRVAYTLNVDGYSETYLGSLSDDGTAVVDAVEPDLPEGVVAGVELDPDGERAAIEFSADDHPHSVYVASAEFGDAERWTTPGTLGIPEDRFLRSETVRYETFDGREIPAYWTLPPGVDEDDDEEVPVMVDIHGGPEHQRRPWFYPTKQYFLNQGYAVLEPNVRGSSGYGKEYTHLDDQEKRLDSVKDVKYATEWLEEQPVADTDRLVVYGRSYGGFMVLSAITQYPDLWAAAVDFVGIADFQTFLENTGEWRREHRAAEYGSLDDPELLERISPIHDVDEIQCPLFIQHGANDPRVPVGEAEQIAEAVEERGIPVETCIFEDEGHHTTDRENLIEEFERIAAFLEEHV